MIDGRERVVVVVGAVIAVLAQLIIAPYITIFSAMPNFIAAYALVVAIARPQVSGALLPFVLGLLFDLFSGGPVGSMAFLLVLATFIASRLFIALNNDTLFIPLLIFGVSALLVEMLYGGFLLGLGFEGGVLDAFIYRALPSALYNCVIGLILYPVMARIFSGFGGARPDVPHVR